MDPPWDLHTNILFATPTAIYITIRKLVGGGGVGDSEADIHKWILSQSCIFGPHNAFQTELFVFENLSFWIQ